MALRGNDAGSVGLNGEFITLGEILLPDLISLYSIFLGYVYSSYQKNRFRMLKSGEVEIGKKFKFL